MTKIKICGIRTEAESCCLNENNVDFAGFVLFFPKSKRNITIEKAKSIFKHLNSSIKKVAVVVSPSKEEIEEINNAGFDYIQIHSDVSKDILNASKIPVLKAFNVSDMKSYNYYHECEKICGYVFDAQTPGSGKTFEWSLTSDIPRDEKMFILAGGLNPQNVQRAIELINPYAVDVSSGVENADGTGKDFDKVKSFVNAVRSFSS